MKKKKETSTRYLAQIAGPITGMEDLNRPVFTAAAEKIKSLGYEVWNPNDWSDLPVSAPNADKPWIDPCKQPKRFWMRRSIQELFYAELLVMLPGWAFSAGANAERFVAFQFGIPVVYWSEHPRAYRCEWREH